MTGAFDWNRSGDIAVRTQMAIAVYLNPFGELVIRQEGQFHPDEDVWVVIAPANVEHIIAAMRAAMEDGDASLAARSARPATTQNRAATDFPLLRAAE